MCRDIVSDGMILLNVQIRTYYEYRRAGISSAMAEHFRTFRDIVSDGIIFLNAQIRTDCEHECAGTSSATA
jgi:hypothetical protein